MNHPTFPFLSVLTPAYKRPKMLEVCRKSVQDQTRADIVHHMIMTDDQGIGVDGQYALYVSVAPLLPGDYIMVLCDDDMLVDPNFVEDLLDIVDEHAPDLVMVKWAYGGRVLPDGGCWQGEPKEGFIGLSNWIVRGDIWRANAQHYGARYAGDFDFINAIWRIVKDRIYWHDKIVVSDQRGRGYGRAE